MSAKTVVVATTRRAAADELEGAADPGSTVPWQAARRLTHDIAKAPMTEVARLHEALG